jgi:hypothetical protein
MTAKIVRRGYDPDDQRIFSSENIAKLRRVQEDVQWLLDRGYKMKQVIEFTGNHYQLSARERTAIQRTASATEPITIFMTTGRLCRSSKILPMRESI